jgi:hypothetical protein
MDDQGTNRPVCGVRFRKLRIAWSSGCAIACLLLIVLWVRSYSYLDFCTSPLGSLHFQTVGGRAVFFALPDQPNWTAGSRPMETVSPRMALRQPCAGWPTSDDPPRGLLGFAIYKQYGLNPAVSAPIWFLVMVAVALGWLPWIADARRFSLRTLLIATTLVAVVLGLAVYAAGK